MITAHIKSPFGDRTEEWDDNKVKPEFKRYLVQFDAYVVGYQGDDGAEILGFFDKEYWDIHEEVLRFYGCEGDYPGLLSFTRGALKQIGTNFQTYLGIEKPFIEQTSIEPDALSEYLEQLNQIGDQNRHTGELIETVVRGLPPHVPPLEQEAVIYVFLHALYDFTFVFQDSITATSDVASGLAKRAMGEEYSSLDYLRELNLLRQVTEVRHTNEAALTAARKPFLALPPEGTPLRSPEELAALPDDTDDDETEPDDSNQTPTPPAVPPTV